MMSFIHPSHKPLDCSKLISLLTSDWTSSTKWQGVKPPPRCNFFSTDPDDDRLFAIEAVYISPVALEVCKMRGQILL
ncbi:hypothetical protein SAMN05216516_10547 [Izhakiella capsodis]|uniref:Uncharacterized protein n=1 Tax=Izhakiella capsodis TaxID=1367852 RepID=A0A1I4XXT7_9GAMM|nr:hypothetical protein SAMN05216516_10547 [Izhakiella capsodis]